MPPRGVGFAGDSTEDVRSDDPQWHKNRCEEQWTGLQASHGAMSGLCMPAGGRAANVGHLERFQEVRGTASHAERSEFGTMICRLDPKSFGGRE
jgi:hypothetical protein